MPSPGFRDLASELSHMPGDRWRPSVLQVPTDLSVRELLLDVPQMLVHVIDPLFVLAHSVLRVRLLLLSPLDLRMLEVRPIYPGTDKLMRVSLLRVFKLCAPPSGIYI